MLKSLLVLLILPLGLTLLLWRAHQTATPAEGLSEQIVEMGLREDVQRLRDSLALEKRRNTAILDTCLGGR